MAIFIGKHNLQVYMNLKLVSVIDTLLQCDKAALDKIYYVLLFCDQIFLVKFFLKDGSYGYQIRGRGDPIVWPSHNDYAKDVLAELCTLQRAARQRVKNAVTLRIISAIPYLKQHLPTDLVLHILSFI